MGQDGHRASTKPASRVKIAWNASILRNWRTFVTAEGR